MAEDTDRFDRALGLPHVTASGVGIIVGAGIYVLLGPASGLAGGLVWLSFLIASALCALTAFSCMELSSMFPKAGAEHEFARQVFPDWVSFTTGWAMVVALIIAAAAVALGFARYAGDFVSIDHRLSALALIAFVGLIASTGMKSASWIIIGLSAIQIGGLVLIIGVGVNHIGEVNLLSGKGPSGVFGAAALIFFAFIGFDEVITLSEETRDPHRTVPRALILALAISTFLYIGVSIVAVSVLGADGLALSVRPLTDVMSETVGGIAVTIVGVIALVTTTNTTLLVVTAASRMIYSMSDTGSLPRGLSRIHNRQAPWRAILAVTITAGGLVLIGDLQLLAAATDALVYAMFILVNVVVILLRKRQPNATRPFRVPFAVGWVPVIPIVGIIVTAGMSSQLDVSSIFLALSFIAAGIVIFFTRLLFTN
jgi:APA family basic amino acid/polyamine antiporter